MKWIALLYFVLCVLLLMNSFLNDSTPTRMVSDDTILQVILFFNTITMAIVISLVFRDKKDMPNLPDNPDLSNYSYPEREGIRKFLKDIKGSKDVS